MSESAATDYITLLEKYLIKINLLLSLGQKILDRIEANSNMDDILPKMQGWEQYQIETKGKNVSEAQRRNYMNYIKATQAISHASTNLQVYKQNKEIEYLIKAGYKIIHELRAMTTGQETTFSVLVNTGTQSQQILKEIQLPLEEILSVGKIEADFHGGKTISSALKMRLEPSKVQQREWAKFYPTRDITDIYTTFAEETDGFLGVVGVGRQYEFFKKGTDSSYLESTTLEELAKVARDTTSFVKGVDYIGTDDITGQKSYESLKSFLGGNPSFANLSTIMSTLTQIQSAISMVATQGTLQEQITQQLMAPNGNTPNSAKVVEEMIRKEVEKALKEIFPMA